MINVVKIIIFEFIMTILSSFPLFHRDKNGPFQIKTFVEIVAFSNCRFFSPDKYHHHEHFKFIIINGFFQQKKNK